MRIDRSIDWDYSDMYRVMDWVDFGNNVGIEIEVDCKYRGDRDDWPNGVQDYSKLYPMKNNEPDFNIFESYENFQQERENWLTEPEHATTIRDIKKSDPIFKYGYTQNRKLIVEHIFETGVIT